MNITEELQKLRATSAREIAAYTDHVKEMFYHHTAEEMSRYKSIEESLKTNSAVVEELRKEIENLKKNDVLVLEKLGELSEDLKPFVQAKSSFIFFGGLLKGVLWTMVTIAGIWAAFSAFIKFVIKN